MEKNETEVKDWTGYYLEILRKELAEGTIKAELKARDKVKSELKAKQKAKWEKIDAIESKLMEAQVEHDKALNEGTGADNDLDESINRATTALAKIQTLAKLREKIDVRFPELEKLGDETQEELTTRFHQELRKLNDSKLTPEIAVVCQGLIDRQEGFFNAIEKFSSDLGVGLPDRSISSLRIRRFF